MTTDTFNQDYNDQRWGTRMPIALMIGSAVVELRARGTYSLTVVDSQRLQTEISDPEDLPNFVGSLVTVALTDAIGQMAQKATRVTQLTQSTEPVAQALRAGLESKLNALGLQLRALKVEAIEQV